MTLELLDRVDTSNGSRGTVSSPAPTALVRVLHVINGEHYAGAERVQDLLAQRLPEFGFEVGFACLKTGSFAARRQARFAPLYDLPMRKRVDLRAANRLAAIVREEGYALVHAHTPRSALIGRIAAWRAGVPMVYHVHSPAIRDTTRVWQNRVNATVERLSLTGVPRLIAVSDSLGRHVRGQGYAAERVTVVHNGVPGPAELVSRSAPTGEWTLGVVALFRPRKGLEVLLEALAALVKAGRPVKLRAIGTFESPDYEREILALADRLGVDGRVEWTGFTSDVPGELAKVDALVLPSLFGEGLPMVILEAMAHGVPVVASAVEGVPEAIRDKIDGLIVRPGDVNDLARVLDDLLAGRHDWSALRESALARHRERFSDRSMAGAVADVYRQVLADANKKRKVSDR